MINRRKWMQGIGLVAGAGLAAGCATQPESKTEVEGKPQSEEKKPKSGNLPLSEYEPKSMLQVRETHVDKARFPVIDIHTHITVSAKEENGVALVPERQYLGTADQMIAVMDRKNIRSMVNLTGGYGSGLADTVRKYDRAFRDRFYSFTEPSYSQLLDPDYPKLQAQAIEQAHKDGARGLKILKTLGLYLRDHITSGKLIKIDDTRFDPMWDTCGQLNMPVAIHVSDPIAFFKPTDRFNERYEELSNHPDWSFHGTEFPSNAELIAPGIA